MDKRINVEGFCNWTVKQGQFAVQPPLPILHKCFTARIHLDDTNEHNGALRVIPGSHLDGIQRLDDISKDTEVICAVPKGGVMIMKPLLMHSSSRTTNNKRRRVIHIEFCDQELPEQLQWSERMDISVTLSEPGDIPAGIYIM
nr:phytanoyl-CoA dioxygenase family protein [Pedobacter sp. JY14-1]